MLIGANFLAGQGAVVAAPDPPALWRPPLGWMTCAVIEAFVKDPLRVFQVLFTMSLALFSVTSFYITKRIWGLIAAHACCLFIMSSPALTSTLVNHVHGLSHILFLMAVGPAIAITVLALTKPTPRAMAGAGALWAFTYCARPDSVPGFAISCCFLFYIALRSGRASYPLVAIVAFFLVITPYTIYGRYVQLHYGISGPSALTTFYASQAWVHGSGDEIAGYSESLDRYGDVERYRNSLVIFLWRHPDAGLSRLRANVPKLLQLYAGGSMCPTIWFAMIPFALLGALWLRTGRIMYAYCLSLLAASFVICLFHVDARYATIGTVPVMLIVCGGTWACWELITRGNGRWIRICGLLCLMVWGGSVGFGAYEELARAVRTGYGRSRVSTDIARKLAADFRMHVDSRSAKVLSVDLALHSAMAPEDASLLVSYFSGAGIHWGGGGRYPKDKIFSMRENPPDYEYVPESALFGTDLLLRTQPLSEVLVRPGEKYYLIPATSSIDPFTALQNQDAAKLLAIVRQKYPEQADRVEAAIETSKIIIQLAAEDTSPADRVGCGTLAIHPDGKRDRVFVLDISAYAITSKKPLMTSVELERARPWGIFRTAASNYLLGVARTETGPLLNERDGSVVLPLPQRSQVWLFACEDGSSTVSSVYRARVRVGESTWLTSNSIQVNLR